MQDKQPACHEKLFVYRGTLYPKLRCELETFQVLEEGGFVAREEDLMLVSYPKCGTNWCMQILHDLAAIKSNDMDRKPVFSILEFGAVDKYKVMESLPSPRVYATHFQYDHIPKSAFQNGTKKLVVFRNPKDTAVSLFHFHAKDPALPAYSSWDDFFPDFMRGNVAFGSYFERIAVWNKHIEDENNMIVTYEELKEDLAGRIKAIGAFFGIFLTEEHIQYIIDRASFDVMKSRVFETHPIAADFLFRKGEVGDWKNYFTEEQNREMDAKFEEFLAGTKLGAKLKYDIYCK